MRARTGRRAFRGDVQALRAVAVAGVVGYHLWPHLLRGGFVGVDVFFVISGFLITQQLVDEMLGTGRIALARFWARRIRRILPAALTVLAACLAVLLLAMPRLTWTGNLAEIRAAAAYFENWLLGAHAVDYLAAESSPSLVQHYWSLSVEEQFYVGWPLLLLLALGITRALGRARLRACAVAVLAAGAVASFVASVTWTAASPAMAFFATPTRAWEFAVGGLLGAAVPAGRRTKSPALRLLAGVAGLGLVGYSYVAITSADAFPGWIAAVPVAGVAMVIGAEAPRVSRSLHRVTELRAVRWTGDASYSIYLWHWPLVIAAPWITHHALTPLDKVGIVVLTLALAGVTKRIVEDPVRSGAWWRSRTVPAYGFAVTGVALLVLMSSTVYTGTQRAAQQASAKAAATIESRTRALVVSRERSCFGAAAMLPVNRCARPYARPPDLDTTLAAADGPSDPCLQRYDATTPQPCVLGAKRAPTRTVAIVGNSHAWRLVPALSLYGERHGWRIVTFLRINCMGLTTTPISSAGASPNCLAWSAAVQRQLLAMRHLDAVVFAGYRFADSFVAGFHAPPDLVRVARRRVLQTWSSLAGHGIPVIVTGDVPGMRPVADPECLAESTDRYDPCARPRASVVKPNLMSDVAQAHPEAVTYLPLTKYFCDAVRCHALVGGVVVYLDSHHITTTYARSLARYLGADIAAALRTQRRPKALAP